MPNVKKLLAKQGTTFADAVDSFPLCCPARATFITGQYAHNHDVAGNFYPFGWYGMKGRKNTLPAWLDRAGYTTAHVGKWLNGYGAQDAHGEVPKGFDIWRGLLDVSAYDYHNFVMNSNGKLRSWGDADFARKLVEFSEIQVTPPAGKGVPDILAKLQEVFGPPPYTYWGAQNPEDYSPDVTGRITTKLVRQQAKSKNPFFIWWSPAAPHREDVAVTLMGRPGAGPAPAGPLRRAEQELQAAAAAQLQRGRPRRQALDPDEQGAADEPGADRPAPAQLRGADRVAARRRRPRRQAREDAAAGPGSCRTR